MTNARSSMAVLAGALLAMAPVTWQFASAAEKPAGVQIAQRGQGGDKAPGGGGGGGGGKGPPTAAPQGQGGGGGRFQGGPRGGSDRPALRSGPRSDGGDSGRTIRSERRDGPAVRSGSERGERIRDLSPNIEIRRPAIRDRARPHRSRAYIHRHGRRFAWGPGIVFWFYDGYYYGDCDWLRRKARATGSDYWWRRYRQCRYWD